MVHILMPITASKHIEHLKSTAYFLSQMQELGSKGAPNAAQQEAHVLY